MITTKTNPIKEETSVVTKLTNIISSIGFIIENDKSYSLSDHISYLLKAFEGSDPKMKNKIENHFVKLGKKAAPSLVNALFQTSGQTRGMIAMALIRIGVPSIKYLEKTAYENSEFKWISDYIITEIEGTQIKVTPALEHALVG